MRGALPARRWEPFFQASTWTFLGEGLVVTLTVGGIALVASLAISVPLGMARSELRGPLGWLVSAWIELVRAIRLAQQQSQLPVSVYVGTLEGDSRAS